MMVMLVTAVILLVGLLAIAYKVEHRGQHREKHAH